MLNEDDDVLAESQAYGTSLFISEEFDTLPEAPIAEGKVKQWRENGRTLSFQFSPVSNGGFAWVTPLDIGKERDLPILPQESKIYPTPIPGLNYTKEYEEFVHRVSQMLLDVLSINTESQNDDRRWDAEIPAYIDQLIALIHEYSAKSHRLADVNNILRCFNAIRFQPDSKNNIASAFASWVNNSDLEQSTELLSELLQTQSPLSNPVFWKCIYTLTIRSMSDLCADAFEAVIKTVPHEQKRILDLVVQCLREYPRDSDTFTFKSWKTAVHEISKSTKSISDHFIRQQLETLFSLFLGDNSTILRLSNSWFEAMSGLLCYNDPTRKQLEEYYITAVDVFPIDESLAWESGCAAVIRGDFLVAIEKTESLDPFVATVISETCDAKGLMDVYIQESFSEVRDWLRINFAKLCLDDGVLAVSGVQLLMAIGSEEARAIFAEYVPKMVLRDALDINMALQAALSFDLEDTARTIHKAVSKRLESQSSYVEALIHLDDIQDTDALRTLSWKLFEECLLLGEPLPNIVLKDAVNNTLDFEISNTVTDFLTPYAILAKAQTYLQQGTSKLAAQHFVALVQFPFLPVKYLGLLFLLTETLLNRSQPRVFSVSELAVVMKAVDKWEDAITNDSVVRRESKQLHQFSLQPIEEGEERDDDPNLFACARSIREKLAKEVSRAYMENPQQ